MLKCDYGKYGGYNQTQEFLPSSKKRLPRHSVSTSLRFWRGRHFIERIIIWKAEQTNTGAITAMIEKQSTGANVVWDFERNAG